MSSPSSAAPANRTATLIGLFIALFGILIMRWAASLLHPKLTFSTILWKEALVWLCVVVLLLIIRRGEKLPLSSIRLGTAPVMSSILWGVILALVCGIVGGFVASLTHFNGGEMGKALFRVPFWVVFLVVLRAGVVEELFYRGYAIERLQSLGLNRYVAAAIPLLIFSFAHGTNGWENIVLAFALGLILAVVYLWRRDLVANMIGHFLVDFISIVVPRLASHR